MSQFNSQEVELGNRYHGETGLEVGWESSEKNVTTDILGLGECQKEREPHRKGVSHGAGPMVQPEGGGLAISGLYHSAASDGGKNSQEALPHGRVQPINLAKLPSSGTAPAGKDLGFLYYSLHRIKSSQGE